MAQQQVTLSPGESRRVSFQTVPDVAKTYSVKVNGLAGSFVAKAEEPTLVFCHHRFVHELPGYGQTTWAITEVEGRIGNLLGSATKVGHAGVEATFRINTGNESSSKERVVLEVLGWWQYGKYVTGVCIYDYNKTPEHQYNRYAYINSGEVLRYVIHVGTGSIRTRIRNASGAIIFDDSYYCDSKRIITFQTELEYWRYSSPGSFNFDGLVTIDDLYRRDVGWVKPTDVCSFYVDTYCPTVPCCEFLQVNHYASGAYWVLEGHVSDG